MQPRNTHYSPIVRGDIKNSRLTQIPQFELGHVGDARTVAFSALLPNGNPYAAGEPEPEPTGDADGPIAVTGKPPTPPQNTSYVPLQPVKPTKPVPSPPTQPNHHVQSLANSTGPYNDDSSFMSMPSMGQFKKILGTL
jgi:hypothetical protein